MYCLQSLRSPQRWPGLTSSPVLEGFAGFASESALSLSSKSSTGSQSDSAGTLQSEQEIDLETLENELRENNTGGRSRLTAVMTIFRGFRIVRKVFMAYF